MASDLLLKFHEGGDSAMLGTLDPFPEILPDGVVSRELEDKPKLLLEFVGPPEFPVLGLDHHEPFALLRRQVFGILAERVLGSLEHLDIFLQLLDPLRRFGIHAAGLPI